jgi:hypothetical protein
MRAYESFPLQEQDFRRGLSKKKHLKQISVISFLHLKRSNT